MFPNLFKHQSIIRRHQSAPFLEERRHYLTCCALRGDSHATLLLKARELLWIARKLSKYPDLNVTREQIRAAAHGWRTRERACGQRLATQWTRIRFVHVAEAWLRSLGYLQRPVVPIPFERQLDEYCRWARHERGLQETTINRTRCDVGQFLRWYGRFGRSLQEVSANDADAYLVHGGKKGWCRVTQQNVATCLRAFFRYTATRGWTHSHLPSAIRGPRIYDLERLPSGPDWTDVKRLLSELDATDPRDIRDRPILMLFAIYGLRASEVAHLRLEHLDWDQNLLRVPRVKRRETQAYPLLPSVGNAIVRYLQAVRRPCAHREIFLTLMSPYRPITRSALYSVVSHRLRALGVRTAHHGPHALRHACAARLIANGLSLKEIGDHLGHRSTSATRIYTKIDVTSLREIAAFDLGELP